MEIKVREPNPNKLNSEGIPQDFADVRDYFNKSLDRGAFPWIPRKTPITNEEILSGWIPSLSTNISLVAEVEGKVVGSATVFYDLSSTSYEHREQRVVGELSSTVSPDTNYKEVSRRLLEGILEELDSSGRSAVVHVAVESPANQSMKELGYHGTEIKKEHYAREGMSGKVIRYELP